MQKVVVSWPEGEILHSDEELLELAQAAGWTDDPKDGRSILLSNGSEIPNPLPVAPPIGFVQRDRLMDLMQSRIDDAREEETAEDMVDFDVPDEVPDLGTIYEFAAMEFEAPAAPPVVVTPEEKAAAELDYEATKARVKRRREADEPSRLAASRQAAEEEEGA